MKDTDRAEKLLVKLARGELRGGQLVKAKAVAKSHPDLAEQAALAVGLDEAKRNKSSSRIDGSSLKRLARQMFRDYRKQQDEPDAGIGITVYDSQVLPLPEGVRPAAVDVRKLKYKVGEWEVELAFYPITVDSFELMGQVTGLENGRHLVMTIQAGRQRFSTEADEHYLFRFPRIPSADCTLQILEDGRPLGRIDLSS